MPEWITGLQTSDWFMIAFAVGVIWFGIDYGLFTPWWKNPLGWVMLGYNLSVVALMGLILFATFSGQRIEEWARIPVSFFLVASIIGKIVILHISRHEGRVERVNRVRRHERNEAHGPQ